MNEAIRIAGRIPLRDGDAFEWCNEKTVRCVRLDGLRLTRFWVDADWEGHDLDFDLEKLEDLAGHIRWMEGGEG